MSPAWIWTSSWKDWTAVQRILGFAAGLASGTVPFGGLGELGLSLAKVLDQGTPAARIGKSFGEMLGAAALVLGELGGEVSGSALSFTGIDALLGVSAAVSDSKFRACRKG